MITLLDKIEEMGRTSFEFYAFTRVPWYDSTEENDDDKQSYKAMLKLVEPIPHVVGSGHLRTEGGESIPVEEFNVDTVFVMRRILEKYKTEFVLYDQPKENGAIGKYEGNLMFDVTSENDVILTNIPIAQWLKNRNILRSRQRSQERIARIRQNRPK